MSALRMASVWIIAFILAAVLAAFLASVTAMQLTSEDTGARVLRRSVAVATDIDALLPRLQEQLRAQAESSNAETVQVPGFPLPVELTREEALTLEGDELRDRILDKAGDTLYDDGMSAWTATDPDADRSIERLSSAGLLDRGLGLISGDRHTAFMVLAIVLGFIAVSLGVLLALALPWDGRLIALGGIGLLASLPPLAAAVAIRFAFRTAETDGDPFLDGLLDIGADSMWVPIRNFFTLTLLSVVVLLAGSALLWWESKNVRITGQTAHTDL